MNKLCILPWLLAGALALSACGGGSSANNGDWVESSASQPPAQSTIAPLLTLPDASIPDAGQPSDSSAAAFSQGGTDPGQPSEGSQEQEVPPAVVSKPQVTTKPEPKSQPEPQTPDTSEETCELPLAPGCDNPPAEPEPQSAPTKADAQAYIGKSVSSLIAAIGQPKGSDYAPSCLGDGEDGELFYDGFTVYTYRVNGTETVQDVV